MICRGAGAYLERRPLDEEGRGVGLRPLLHCQRSHRGLSRLGLGVGRAIVGEAHRRLGVVEEVVGAFVVAVVVDPR